MKSTTKRAKVSIDFRKKDASSLCEFGDGTIAGLTGSLIFTLLVVSLTEIADLITKVRSVAGLISSGESTPANYKLLAQYMDDLLMALIANGHYVEDKANLVAAGDLTKAEELILSTGYKLAKRGTAPQRSFEVVETGAGYVHVRAAKTKKGQSLFLWRFGVTPEKGKVPDKLIPISSDKVNVLLTDLPSKSVVAIQYSENELVSKVKKYGYPTFSYTAEEFYIWSDFIYVVVP